MSFLLALPFLALIIWTMICFLNLNGYLNHDSTSYVYIKPLSDLSVDGAIFARGSNWRYLLLIAQPLLTLILNREFRIVATKSTENENHKYLINYRNSYLLKRYIFEFFGYNFPIFYMAYYRMDPKALRELLVYYIIYTYIDIILWCCRNQ